MPVDSVQEMICRVLKALVEHPDEVQVRPIEGENTIVFEVQVNSEDAGKVIGRKGRTINSLRTIIRAVSSLGNKKVMMELV